MKIKWNSHDVNLTVWTVKRKSDGKYLQHAKNGDIIFCDSPYKYHMTLDQVKKYMTSNYTTYWAERGEFQHKLHNPQLNINVFEFAECGADSWTYMIVKNETDLPKHRYDIVGG